MRTIALFFALAALVGFGLSPRQEGDPATRDAAAAVGTDAPDLAQLRRPIENVGELDPQAAHVRLGEGAGPTCIAFSVAGIGHESSGEAALLRYDAIVNNDSAPWTGATFVVPRDGVYCFALSFVASAEAGEADDDVFVTLRANGHFVGHAWKGRKHPRIAEGTNRTSAAYTVTVPLKRGDLVQSYVSSHAGLPRRLAAYDFTGYYVCP